MTTSPAQPNASALADPFANLRVPSASACAAADARTWRELRFEIEEFNTRYADILDRGDLNEWPEQFTEKAFYRVLPRENADAGLPAGLVHCENKAMLKDRVFALLNTAMFERRYYRHMISNTRVTGVDADGVIHARANYLLLETIIDEPTRVLQAGEYVDQFVREGDTLLLKHRDCVYDSSIVHVALVYPA